MKRVSLVVLLLLLGIVIAAYLLKESPKAEDATFVMPINQLSLNPARVMRVDITRAHSFIRIEKMRGEWKVTEPVYATVDPAKLKELQEAIASFRLNGMVSSNPEKQSLFQVDDNGTNVLFVNDDGSTLSLIVGKAAPTPGTAFIRTPLSDTVYIAQGLTPGLVNRDLREWRQRGVYEIAPDSVFAFSVSGGARRYEFKRGEQGWTSRGQSVSAGSIEPVVASISNLQAEGFIDSSIIIRNRARYQVEISGANGARMEFYPPMGLDSNYILKASNSSTLALVRPSVAKELQHLIESLAPVEIPAVAEAEPPPVQKPAPQPAPAVRQTTQPATQQPAQSPANTPVTTPPPAATNRVERPRRTTTERRVTPEPTQRTVVDEGDLTVHTVKRGENINSIAKKYDVTIEQLKKWNGLQNDNVIPGMEMYVFVKKK